MNYFFARTLSLPFDEAITRVTALLKEQGFGILTDIDVQDTFRKKLDVSFRRYRILGACNPGFAHKALEAEDKIGTMLPCNVIVQDVGEGMVEIAAVDPVASMSAVHNEALAAIAGEVRDRLSFVIRHLQ